jgi:NAD+ synthase (glutamine-hydrolysing)
MLGYVRAAAAVPKLKVADCDYNAEQIMSLVNKAYESGVNVIVFPELCLTGYSCGDLFFQSALTDGAQRALLKLMEETAGMDMIIAVGFPLNVRNRIFNCAVLLHKGEILGVIPKTYLPNSEEFMEKRWFSPADNITGEEVSICGKSVPMGTDILFECSNGGPVIGVEICQDVWEVIPPSSYQALSGANVILNLTASNEVGTKHLKRRLVVSSQSGKTLSAYVFSASGIGESTTDMVFCGHSIIAENGTILNETKRFYKESQLIISDIDFEMINKERRKHNGFTAPMGYGGVKPFRFIKVDTVLNVPDRLMRTVPINPFVPEDRETAKIFYDDVLSIQSVGLARRMEHVGSLKCVLGLSGGLDSALALMVTVKALDFMGLDRKNLIAVVMPGFGTSQRTYENAKRLAYAMGVTYREISIKEACELHFKDIGHDINNKNVVFENVQARERTQILMDIANTENGLVVGTGDMSELALGFTT